MKTQLLWFLASNLTVAGQAADFPLVLKQLSLEEALICPGGYGMQGQIMNRQANGPTAEPKAASAHPLYGEFYSSGGKPIWFRIDESQGTGKGYDRLIIDFNHNGDLTDDPVAEKVSSAQRGSSMESVRFGPIVVPQKIGKSSWQPTVCAEVNLYNRSAIGSSERNTYIGYVNVRPGWLLEATIELKGVTEKIAFQDGNCNFRLPEKPQVSKIMRSQNDPGSWYLSPADYVLRGADASGKYRRDMFANTAEAFYSTLYFKGSPYTVKLKDDLSSVSVQACTGPMGQFTVPDKLSDIVLARKLAQGDWEPISPQIKEGKICAPAGEYRVVSCAISAKDRSGSLYKATCNSPGDKILTLSTDQAQPLDYGVPLELKVTSERVTNQGEPVGLMAKARSLFSSTPASQALTMQLNLTIAGKNGEPYQGFYIGKPGRESVNRMSTPRFRALDSGGKEVASGTFEFG
jgi:hypothetical protein